MKLPEKRPLILDGAAGSEMIKHGYKTGTSLEKWILEHPEHITELQKRYIEAGSDVVYAPTFGANRLSLKKYGLEASVRDINLRLAEITLELSRGKVPVGGDIAPTGAILEPFGDMSAEKLIEIYAEQIKSLEEAGVDFYAVETQLSGEEAKAAVSAIKQNSDKPIFVSFTCNEAGKSFYGEAFKTLLCDFQELGVAAFGINCCGDFELIKRIVTEMKPSAKIPLLVKPNAGKPSVRDGVSYYTLPPETFAKQMLEIKKLGASMLGGCCGTDLRHVSALVDAVQFFTVTKNGHSA